MQSTNEKINFNPYRGRRIDEFGNPVEKDGISIEGVEGSNGRAWTGRVRYKALEAKEALENAAASSGVSFGALPSTLSTTGGTARMRRSLGTTAYAIGGTAPNFNNMIGWNGEDFDGCDVVVPNFSFELVAKTPAGFVGNFGAFADSICPLIGTVNSRPFWGLNPGVVLFRGISSGSLQTSPATETEDEFQYWTLTYSFATSPNVELDVEGVKVAKPGWAYYWALTEKSFDETNGVVVPEIRAVYVEKVYKDADFSLLGIGG